MSYPISDRFIPIRSPQNQELSSFLLRNEVGTDPYDKKLFQQMFSLEEVPPILNFRKTQKYTPIFSKSVQKREVPFPFPECTKRLDAPDISDDFYSHPLTSDKDHFAVTLRNAIYLYNLSDAGIDKLSASESLPICIDLPSKQSILNVGTANNDLSRLDLITLKIASKITMPQFARVTRQTGSVIYTGCDQGMISEWDTRALNPTYLTSSDGKVCNIAIGEGKLAAGFNDNIVKIWDIRKKIKPYAVFDEFTAGVKALAWHPNGSLIAGGGTRDKTIKILNVNENRVLSSINTKMQVANIHLNNEGNRLISTHGFRSEGPLSASCVLWSVCDNALKFQSSSEPQDQRFLHSTVAEDNSTFITSYNEVIQIYQNAFPRQQKNVSEPFTLEIR